MNPLKQSVTEVQSVHALRGFVCDLTLDGVKTRNAGLGTRPFGLEQPRSLSRERLTMDSVLSARALPASVGG